MRTCSLGSWPTILRKPAKASVSLAVRLDILGSGLPSVPLVEYDRRIRKAFQGSFRAGHTCLQLSIHGIGEQGSTQQAPTALYCP